MSEEDNPGLFVSPDYRDAEKINEIVSGPAGEMMAANTEEEFYRLLMVTAHEAPLPIVANCIEVMATVLNKRMHEEMGEFYVAKHEAGR